MIEEEKKEGQMIMAEEERFQIEVEEWIQNNYKKNKFLVLIIGENAKIN